MPCTLSVKASLKYLALGLGLIGSNIALAQDSIEVGVPIPLTGPYAGDGQVMQRGIELAIQDINAAGGLLGKQLTSRLFDIGDLTPDKLQAAASELIERRNVAVLVNGYGGMGPDIPAFCPHQQPYLNNNATEAVVDLAERLGCDNIFMASDFDRHYGEQAFSQLMNMGYSFTGSNMAVLYGPYDWEVGKTSGMRSAAEQAGWKVSLNEEVPYGTSQWASTLNKLRRIKPDLIVLEMLDPSSISTFLEQWRRAPIAGTQVYVGYALSTPSLSELVARGGYDGVLGMTLSAQRDNPQGHAFNERWQAAYNEPAPLSIAAQVYDEVMLWADAVQRAGSYSDYAAVKRALTESQLDGLTGTLVFNERHYVSGGDDTQPAQLLQAQGGKVITLMTGNQMSATFINPDWVK